MASSIADALVAGDYHRVISAQADFDGSQMGDNAASIASLLGSLSDHTIAGDYNQKCEWYDALFHTSHAKGASATSSKVREMIQQGAVENILEGNLLLDSKVGTNHARNASSTSVLLNRMVAQGDYTGLLEAASAIDDERKSNFKNNASIKSSEVSDITIARLSKQFELFLGFPTESEGVRRHEYHSIRDGTDRLKQIFRDNGVDLNYSFNSYFEKLEQKMKAADMYSPMSVFPEGITYCLVRRGFKFPPPEPIPTSEGLPSPPSPIGNWKIDWSNIPVTGKLPYGSGDRGIREGGGGPTNKFSDYAQKQHERFVTLADLYRAEKSYKGDVYLVYTDTDPPQIVNGEVVKEILLGWGFIKAASTRMLRERKYIMSIMGPAVIFFSKD